MPRFRRSRGASVSRGPRRKTAWGALGFGTDAALSAENSLVFVGGLTAASLADRPFTIVRVVGNLFVNSDQNAALETPFGAWGMAVVSDQAVAVGVTALPDPVSDANSDLWFAYQGWSAEGTLSSNAGRPTQQLPFDFRAMRKVEEGMDVVIMFGNASVTSGAEFVLNLRFLVKLH